MTVVELDASRWTGVDDFYAALLTGLGAPSWHGRSLDALVDSMIVGGINAVEQPFTLLIHDLDRADRSARDKLQDAIDALVSEGAYCTFGNDGTATITIASPLSSGHLKED